MAEFYSANLATEIKKGMRQKVQIGGWTHRAPIGYINRKESVEGRRIAYVEPDPNRAPLIRLAEWQSVLDLAMRLATNCANAYRLADHRIKRHFNEAVFEEIVVRDGHVAEARYHGPLRAIFCARVRTLRSRAGDGTPGANWQNQGRAHV